MSITAKEVDNGQVLVIRVDGRFDYRANREFRTAMETGKPSRYVLDLTGADYMDSSALGMMLILRDSVGGDGRRIKITGANASVRKILDVARFGDIFDIE